MKRKVTLLSMFVLVGAVSFGQIHQITNQKSAAAEKLAPVVTKSNQSPSQAKAGGDIVWENNFENAAEWTATGPGSDYINNGWSIGTTVTNSWAFASGTNMGTTGSFARFANNNPTMGTQIEGQFTLEYNSTFDLTGVPVPHIEFEQYGAKFADMQAVQISLDGVVWTTVIDNQDMPMLTAGGGSAYPRPMTKRANIASFLTGDISNVRIRLFWDGGMNGANMSYITYGWFVDNLRIVEGYEDDLTLKQRFSSIGGLAYQYTKFAASQVNGQTITFGGVVVNNGVNSQNAVLHGTNVAGFDQVGAPVSIASLGRDSVAIVTANGWPLPTTPGVHNFTLTVEGDDVLDNTADDELMFNFEVTQNIMAVDAFTGAAASMSGSFLGWASPTGDPSIGTWFEIFENTGVDRIQIGIANIAAASQGDYIGNPVLAQLYYYDPIADDFIFLGITPEHEITSADFGKIVNLYFDERIQLTAGMDVVALASFYDGSIVPIATAGTSQAGTTIGRDGASWVTLIADAPGNVVRAPVVRLDFGNYIGFDEYAISSENVSLYPNPASDNATIAYSLNTESNVSIEVRDLAGKLVYSSEEGKLSAGSHNMTISTATLADGMYTYTLVANGAQVTNKFVVKK